MAPATIRKFLFDEDFDDPFGQQRTAQEEASPAQPEAEPEPPPPTFTQDQLVQARKQGYDEGQKAGRLAGHKAGKAEVEGLVNTRISQALTKIANSLDRLTQEHAALAAARTREPVEITLTILRRLWPELERRHGIDEIEAMVSKCLADFVDEPRVVVTVNTGMIEQIKGRVVPLTEKSGFGGRLVVAEDDKLGPADCRVEWAKGGAARESRKLLALIDEAATRLLASQ